MAEGVGFEPTVGCPTLDFESSALNRTQPPFPIGRYCRSYFMNAQLSDAAPSLQKAKHRTIWRFLGGCCEMNQRDIEALVKGIEA